MKNTSIDMLQQDFQINNNAENLKFVEEVIIHQSYIYIGWSCPQASIFTRYTVGHNSQGVPGEMLWFDIVK